MNAVELSSGPALASVIEIVVLVIEFAALAWVLVDLFRRHDISAGQKGLWLVGLVILPLIVLLVYVFTRIFFPEIASRRDISAGKKLVWLAFFLLLTPIALFTYVLIRRRERAPAIDVPAPIASAGQEGTDGA